MKRLDTLHIPVWLAKDIAWLLVYKPLGALMIVPAVSIAVHVCIKSAHNKLLFFQNFAILSWILANSTWMAGEFFQFEYRIPAMIFFASGIAAILRHYFLEYNLKNHPLTKFRIVRYFTKKKI